MFVVTGASSNHFKSLLNLIQSGIHFNEKFIVYDLGLEKKEVDLLQTFDVILKKFNYLKYPSFVYIGNNSYAWKPIIIQEVMNELKDDFIWLDAGCLIHNRLNRIRQEIKLFGFYSPISSGTISTWTHKTTQNILGVTENIRNKYNVSGGIVGVNNKIVTIRKLIDRWVKYALTKECIVPKGSSRKNHRQDQAILSVLLHQFYEKNLIQPCSKKLLDISIHNDVE
jgi:hypothetical protein